MTIFILIVSMFFLGVILLINIGIMNKNANQEKELDQLSKNYKVTDRDMEQTYLKALGEDSFVTMDDVQKMIEEVKENMQKEIEGKMAEAKLEAYPIGSIYISTNNTNPETLFGGKWEQYARGRTLIGEGKSDRQFNAEETGGESSHILTINEMPSHTHNVTATGSITSTFKGTQVDTTTSGNHTHKYNTGNGVLSWPMATDGTSHEGYSNGGWGYTTAPWNKGAQILEAGNHTHKVTAQGTVTSTFNGSQTTTTETGKNTKFNILQPYIVTYMWRRTA